MTQPLLPWLACLLLAAAAGNVAAATPPLAPLEAAYADLNDAYGAVGLIESGFRNSYQGKDGAAWRRIYAARLAELNAQLPAVHTDGLPPPDARALQVMREGVAALSESSVSLAPAGRCQDATRQDLALTPLTEALYACFAELANNLEFEGGKVNRVGAFDLLTRLDEPARRRALFYAFVPLWQAVNGHGEAGSPYRRMLRMAAARAREHGSAIDAAARTVGTSPAEVERWLVQILDTWRQVTPAEPIEPWDYRYRAGAAERELGAAIARESLLPLSLRFYRDLGIDLEWAGVMHDVEPRAGKAPLAYADYVSRGRLQDGAWQPTVARISASYSRGGLGLLNELVHEHGHAVHMLALRTRPAFMDLGDTLFVEAFADVPSWSTYEPAWQRKYLGTSAEARASLRALYASVMLDVAWGLFDLRMLREPDSDPNAVWTDITSRYLHVVPHPELPWWAVRVQLVHEPGYMVNYGLGAVLTADLRQRVRERLGNFDTGDPHWYGWLAQELLRAGQERETVALLRDFLGRPISPQALLGELQRLAPAAAAD